MTDAERPRGNRFRARGAAQVGVSRGGELEGAGPRDGARLRRRDRGRPRAAAERASRPSRGRHTTAHLGQHAATVAQTHDVLSTDYSMLAAAGRHSRRARSDRQSATLDARATRQVSGDRRRDTMTRSNEGTVESHTLTDARQRGLLVASASLAAVVIAGYEFRQIREVSVT